MKKGRLPMSLEPVQGRVSFRPTFSASGGASKAPEEESGGAPPQAPEEERTRGHGHGMARNRVPAKERGLPHDRDHDQKQPYAGELDDYSGGAGSLPDNGAGRGEEPKPPRDR